MQESSLHEALKNLYTSDGKEQEVNIDGYLVDAVQGNLLIEIQTRNFSAIKPKLAALLDTHLVRLVHPIAHEKWILRLPAEGDKPQYRRRSPRRGRLEHLFLELVRIPHLVKHPNFSLEVLLVREEEIRRDDGKGSWRRKGVSIIDRRLFEVLDRQLFTCAADYRRLLPMTLPETFSNLELAAAIGITRSLAGKMTYCLRAMNILTVTGKHGNALLYTRTPTAYNSTP